MKDNAWIVHIINHDKFTSGYVRFMQTVLTEYRHSFLIPEGGAALRQEGDIVRLKGFRELLTNAEVRRRLRDCDRILVDGVFGAEIYLSFFRKEIWEKTQLYFWGGDYCQYRKCTDLSKWIHKQIFRSCAARCRGWIFLYPEEAAEFRKIFPMEKMTQAARMPADPLNHFRPEKYRGAAGNDGKLRIIVGNSATASNCHGEIFRLLARYPLERMEVLCPLSYGNEPETREAVLREGRRLLGDSFRPMLDFVEPEAYMALLSTVDVGIYNADRQQGIGNINRMLSLGKKVYLRAGTSMWKYYVDQGYRVFDIAALEQTDFETFGAFAEAAENERIWDGDDRIQSAAKQWRECLR